MTALRPAVVLVLALGLLAAACVAQTEPAAEDTATTTAADTKTCPPFTHLCPDLPGGNVCLGGDGCPTPGTGCTTCVAPISRPPPLPPGGHPQQ